MTLSKGVRSIGVRAYVQPRLMTSARASTAAAAAVAGIDAVIYSRTIVSLLQQNEPDDPLRLSPPPPTSAHRSRRASLTDCASVLSAKSKNRLQKKVSFLLSAVGCISKSGSLRRS